MKVSKKIIISIFIFALLFAYYCFSNKTSAEDTPTPSITITDAAAIRTTDPYGLRFEATINGTFDEGVKYYFAFVKGTPDTATMQELIEDTLANPSTPKVSTCEATNNEGVIMASVVNFGADSSHYTQKITAMAYAVVNDTNTFSSSTNRNILEVARKAYGYSKITDSNVISYLQGIAETGKIAVTNSSGITYYNTIADLNTNLADGDTVDFIAGTYDEALTIDKDNVTIYGSNKNINPNTETRNTESLFTNFITIQSDNVNLNGISVNGKTIILDGCEDTTLNYIKCETTPIACKYVDSIVDEDGRRACIYDTNSGVTNIKIENSYIRAKNATGTGTYINRDCVFFNNISGLTIENNVFEYKLTNGTSSSCETIGISNMSGEIKISDNTIKYPTKNWSIYLGSETNSSNSIELSNNEINGYGEKTTAGVCIKNCGASCVTKIQDNTFNDIDENAFSFEGSVAGSVFLIDYNKFEEAYKITKTGDGAIRYYCNIYDAVQTTLTGDYKFVETKEQQIAFKEKSTTNTITATASSIDALNTLPADVIVSSSCNQADKTLYKLTGVNSNLYDDRVYEQGVTAFSTISAAYTYLSTNNLTGRRIFVENGTYADDLTIEIASTLYGPNCGINGTNTRKDEAIFSGQITLASDNITIDGLKLLAKSTEKYCVTTSKTVSDISLKNILQSTDTTFTGTNGDYYGIIYSSYNINSLLIENSKFYITNGINKDVICVTGKINGLDIINNYFSNGNSNNMNEAIFVLKVSGVINISENTFNWGNQQKSYKYSDGNYYNRGYVIALGNKNVASSNSCTTINISYNTFEGKNQANSIPGISINSLPNASITNIIGNDFISNYASELPIFNFRNGKEGSTVNINYNYFNENIKFNIEYPASTTLNIENDCFAGGVNSTYSSSNSLSSIGDQAALKSCYDDIRHYILTNTALETNSAATSKEIKNYITDFDDKYVDNLKIESGVILYNTASTITEFVNAAKAAGLSGYTPD